MDPNVMDSKRNTALDRALMSADRAMINLVERRELWWEEKGEVGSGDTWQVVSKE